MKRFATLISLFVVAIILPSNQRAVFDGLPFSGMGELVGMVLLTLPLVVRRFRQTLQSRVSSTSQKNVFLTYCLVALVLSLKLAMFLVAPTSGHFEVCYRSYAARSGVPCSPTFEPIPLLAKQSELFAQRSTDVPVIDFNTDEPVSTSLSGSNWRLPTVNSLAFDRGFWGWEPDDKQIEVFPFFAEFRGRLSLAKDEKIRITYIGQGRVVLSGGVSVLEASYESPQSLLIGGPLKKEVVVIDYSFLRTARNSEAVTLPYAALRVEKVSGNQSELARSRYPTSLRMMAVLSDLGILSMFALAYWELRRHRRGAAVALALGAACWLLVQSRFTVGLGEFQIEASIVFVLGITFYVMSRRRSTLLLAPAYLSTSVGLVVAEVEFATGSNVDLGDVLVRLRGNDHLVYHGFAREMLSSGFLRGGEDVFYFQPGIRYIFYLQQVLFGESGVLTGIASVFAMGLGILCVAERLDSSQRLGRSAQVVGILSLLVWWSSSHTSQSSIFGLSEFATWILLLFITAVLMGPVAHLPLFFIAVASGSIIWIRPNQGLAVMVILVIASLRCLRQRRNSRSRLMILLSVFISTLALIPLHNLVFGRTPAFLPGGHLGAGQMSWGTVWRSFSDELARNFVVDQIRGIAYLPSVLSDIYSTRLALSLAGFLLAMILALAGFVMRKSHRDWPLLLLGVLALVAQIVPFLKYTIYRYYPIHNIAIYLTALLMILLATSSMWSTELSKRTSNSPASADLDIQ